MNDRLSETIELMMAEIQDYGIFVLDPFGIVKTWNNGAQRIKGYDADEIIGQHFSVFYQADEIASSKPQLALSIAEHEGRFEELGWRVRKDGSLFWADVIITALRNLNGELLGYGKVTRDMTEFAKHVDEKFHQVVENWPNGVLLVDRAGRIVLVNTETEKMFGYQKDELLSHPIEILIPSRFREQQSEHSLNFSIKTRSEMAGAVRDLYWLRKEGSEFPIEIGLTPLKTEAGRQVLVSVIDISERKRGEDGLRIARDQAQAASAFKSQFVANVSHEIRTPMNAIIGMCNLLMRTSLNDIQRQYGQSIKEAGHALLNIVNDILDLSKIEANKLELEIVDFDLVQVVESTCNLLRSDARGKEISLVSFIEPKMPALLRGDPERLRQVLMNFLNNAIKFSAQNEVVVRATVANDEGNTVQILFSVEDKGIGLSDADCQKLFQPFVQTDAGIGRKYGGTGLGLSICKSLVTLMGGKIGVSSTPGSGSTFWCKVPFEKRSLSPVIAINDALESVRILIVDDQPGAREILHKYVISWGMRNGVASSSTEALDMLRQAHSDGNSFNLAIIDLVMPGKNGVELAQEILQDPTIDTVKLILLTGFDEPGLGKQVIDMGFRGYLTKPVRQSQLLDCITNVLYGTTSASRVPVVDFGEISISEILGRNELILIVEDHPVNQKVISMYLSDMGFKSHISNNGLEALEALSLNQYGLLLMDCQMPELDGFAATKIIRQKEALTGSRIPIIAMTANAMAGDREKCIAAGMDDYISKPIDQAQLRVMLKRWLSLAKAPTSVLRAAAVADIGPIVNRPIDIDKLLSIFNLKMASNLLSMFKTLTPETLGQITAAIENDDRVKLAALAHYLKGACGTVCAIRLDELCSQLETIATEGSMAEARAKNEQLQSAFHEAEQYLDTHLTMGGKVDASN